MEMMVEYYETIFKRKSFHLFKGVGHDKITREELDGIRQAYDGFVSLYPETRTAIRIVPAEKVSFKHDAEYCILIYSEKKENYLMNAGYLGEQLDLYLVRHHIGSLWFGIGKPDEATFDGMDYVIMIAIRKVNDDTKYRHDMFKAARKPLAETWSGESMEIADIARFAPSACNSQPWRVENKTDMLTVYRYRRPGKIGIMPPAAVPYFNRIDMGIYLCILEICLAKKGYTFRRTLFEDAGGEAGKTRVAEYRYSLNQSVPD